ncbi:hypothetical protein C2S52_015809 [Perilla frutescens var. hirtella]|nr:hypothetical protein C2S52_015809 [Perilla frutescens var. hirtella]
MAANLQSSRLASFGKRFVAQIRSLDSVAIPSLSIRKKSVHVSAYDKNPEEQFRADDVIPRRQAEHYWCPHPQTGVFGPAKDHKPAALGGLRLTAACLDQKPFFRPLEDLDKPLQS